MVEIGELPVPVGGGQDPGGHPALRPHPTDQRAHPVGLEGVAPGLELLLDRPEGPVVQPGDPRGVETPEPRQREGPGTAGVAGPEQGFEQPPPLGGGRRLEHGGAPGQHRGDLPPTERLLGVGGLHGGAHEDGDVGGEDPPPAVGVAVAGAGAGPGSRAWVRRSTSWAAMSSKTARPASSEVSTPCFVRWMSGPSARRIESGG